MIFILKGNLDYPKNCYYFEKYETKEEAIEGIYDCCNYLKDYIFIEGEELKLTLDTTKN